ncbi:hypothetical protein AN958_03276 [Leucoagaricus sp. SymC.cos]|nr:hypothetical protein AN958_03276 [Leucoagaricus sp. SymC.cos]
MINSAIYYLLKTATIAIERIGQNLLVTFAYNNLKIDIKSLILIVEFADDSILHLIIEITLTLHPKIPLNSLQFLDWL